MNLDELLSICDDIAADDVSGATELTMLAADLLLESLGNGLVEPVAQRLMAAKPMMASMVNVVRMAMSGDDVKAASRMVREFRESLETAPNKAGGLVPGVLSRAFAPPFTVLTVSASAVTEAAIIAMESRGQVSRVIVGESRPRNEGAMMAVRLRKRVKTCRVTHDAALPGLVGEDAVVLIGADAVLPDRVVNKSGSFPLCLAAQRASCPAIVATTTHKILHEELVDAYQQPLALPDDSGFMDLQFESVPRDLLYTIVTEGGVL